MAHVKLQKTTGSPSMTDDLFKLIEGAGEGSGEKKGGGLFSSFWKKPKIGRRSIQKEFEHQALDGPSYSAESEHTQNEANSGGDDAWNVEGRDDDDWGFNYSQSPMVTAQTMFDGFPPLPPGGKVVSSRAGEPPDSAQKRQPNPKVLVSRTPKKKENDRKPKDFSLTQMISQSFDNEPGSENTVNHEEDEIEGSSIADDQSISVSELQPTEYAQLDPVGNTTKVTRHVADHQTHQDPEATEEIMKVELRQEEDIRSAMCDDVRDSDIDATVASFKDRLAFYKTHTKAPATPTKARYSEDESSTDYVAVKAPKSTKATSRSPTEETFRATDEILAPPEEESGDDSSPAEATNALADSAKRLSVLERIKKLQGDRVVSSRVSHVPKTKNCESPILSSPTAGSSCDVVDAGSARKQYVKASFLESSISSLDGDQQSSKTGYIQSTIQENSSPPLGSEKEKEKKRWSVRPTNTAAAYAKPMEEQQVRESAKSASKANFRSTVSEKTPTHGVSTLAERRTAFLPSSSFDSVDTAQGHESFGRIVSTVETKNSNLLEVNDDTLQPRNGSLSEMPTCRFLKTQSSSFAQSGPVAPKWRESTGTRTNSSSVMPPPEKSSKSSQACPRESLYNTPKISHFGTANGDHKIAENSEPQPKAAMKGEHPPVANKVKSLTMNLEAMLPVKAQQNSISTSGSTATAPSGSTGTAASSQSTTTVESSSDSSKLATLAERKKAFAKFEGSASWHPGKRKTTWPSKAALETDRKSYALGIRQSKQPATASNENKHDDIKADGYASPGMASSAAPGKCRMNPKPMFSKFKEEQDALSVGEDTVSGVSTSGKVVSLRKSTISKQPPTRPAKNTTVCENSCTHTTESKPTERDKHKAESPIKQPSTERKSSSIADLMKAFGPKAEKSNSRVMKRSESLRLSSRPGAMFSRQDMLSDDATKPEPEVEPEYVGISSEEKPEFGTMAKARTSLAERMRAFENKTGKTSCNSLPASNEDPIPRRTLSLPKQAGIQPIVSRPSDRCNLPSKISVPEKAEKGRARRSTHDSTRRLAMPEINGAFQSIADRKKLFGCAPTSNGTIRDKKESPANQSEPEFVSAELKVSRSDPEDRHVTPERKSEQCSGPENEESPTVGEESLPEVKPQGDFASKLQFFKARSPEASRPKRSKPAAKSVHDDHSVASTRLETTSLGDYTIGGHPIYVVVDGNCNTSECLSPSPRLLERKIVCGTGKGASYFERLESFNADQYSRDEALSAPTPEHMQEDEPDTREKYDAVKSRFSQKSLPWRQQNAAGRYLERKRNAIPDETQAPSSRLGMDLPPRKFEVDCPISQSPVVDGTLLQASAENMPTAANALPARDYAYSPFQTSYGTPVRHYNYRIAQTPI